ncbi:hypothetical protein DPMN_062142 [Dreissena polymorpha]|uniref:Uncharacterized protein n=1 Tax=Dreissena polymorpha TaxID=45954 RepID=A0A9D4C932_DREPO|nr:hypothetical protein DPMN_062142 [Dreissena polymorpha]
MKTEVPADRPGFPRSRTGTNRDDPWPFDIFERRRSSEDHHPDDNTASTRTKLDSNKPSTRRPRGLSRAVTEELRTYTAEKHINTDQHGIYTDHPGPIKRQ